MATTTGTQTLTMGIAGNATGSSDLASPASPISQAITTSLANGTSANQINRRWSDTRSLASAASEEIDLAGSLTDEFGNAVTFAKVKAIIIYNKATDPGDDLVLGTTATGGDTCDLFLDPSDGINIDAKGVFVWLSPVDGFAVGAGTTDKLKIKNSSSDENSISYDIYLFGTSS